MPRKILLTGFMGAGKTTVGRRLAARLELPFVDLDAEVERLGGSAVAEIFDRHGEPGFRRLELEALTAVLERSEVVLATGGGTAAVEPAAALLRAGGVTVWLDVPFATLFARLGKPSPDSESRPLLGTGSETEALYRSRLAAYRACDVRVEVEPEEQPDEIAARIECLLV